MIGYKIKVASWCGYENERKQKYTLSYDKAVQIWNDSIREQIKIHNDMIIDKDEFSECVSDFKETELISFIKKEVTKEFLYSVRPFIAYKDLKTNNLVARIKYWEDYSSCPESEQDITECEVILEQIEIE